jgi:hypothetical protein
VPLVGGFSGDEPGHRRTYQFHDETVFSDAVIGIALGSDAPIGIGLGHGWKRRDAPMIVTKSSADRIYEIDDEPALDVLLRRTGAADAGELFTGTSMLAIGLSRRSGEDLRVLHAADEDDRSVRGLADVPQGALCWVMDGDPGALIAGAADSCAEALEGLGGRAPLGVLAFDCAGRRSKLGLDGMQQEMAAMRDVLGGTPYAGFYTTAEIARVRGALGTHHLTLVTLALA